MSTTDTGGAFEAWAITEGLISDSHGIRFVNSMCEVARKAFNAGIAHTEAAKATGTAGKPVAWQFEENTHPDRRSGGGIWERKVEHTFRPESFIAGSVRNVRPLVYAEAARQPAPVLAVSEKDERDNEIFELQKALAFWLPQVNQFMSDEMSQRIARDAYMLVIDGNLPDDFKTAQELGWILPATGKVQRDAEMVCGNCMEPIAATNRSQP